MKQKKTKEHEHCNGIYTQKENNEILQNKRKELNTK